MIQTGCHPEYGFTEEYRQDILMWAKAHGVKSAAEKFRVHQATIYAWLARIKENDEIGS